LSGRRRESLLPRPDQKWSELLRAATLGELTGDDLARWREEAKTDRRRRISNPAMPGQTVVYYIRFRDRIKIGYTSSIRERLTTIPHDELLALEIGDRELEQARHRQFAHLNEHGEWFRAEDELLEHARRVREEYPWDH
jgi:hypothetical protein